MRFTPELWVLNAGADPESEALATGVPLVRVNSTLQVVPWPYHCYCARFTSNKPGDSLHAHGRPQYLGANNLLQGFQQLFLAELCQASSVGTCAVAFF